MICLQMLQYYAKNFFTPVLATLWTIPAENALGLYVVSDLTEPLAGVVVLTFWSYSATAPVTTWNQTFAIPELSAVQVGAYGYHPVCV